MSQADFFTYVTDKYDSEETLYSGIHHYESREVKTTDGSIIIPRGEKVGVGQSVSYYDDALGQHVRATDIAIPITNFDYEEKLRVANIKITVIKDPKTNPTISNKIQKGPTRFN